MGLVWLRVWCVQELMGWVQDLSDQVVRADNPQVRAQRNEQEVLSTMCTTTGDQLRQVCTQSILITELTVTCLLGAARIQAHSAALPQAWWTVMIGVH